MINLQTKNFENQLLNLINNSGLPVANAYLVIKDIYNQITKLYEEQIQNELKQQQEQNNQNENDSLNEENEKADDN